jgi:hypothetical protein
LYVAVGVSSAGDGPANAQSLTSLRGKILRINPDGTIPTDNPFYAQASGEYRAIWALGLHSPSLSFGTDSLSNQRMLISDSVDTWNRRAVYDGVLGGNYGYYKITSDFTPIVIYGGNPSGPLGDTDCSVFYNPASAQFPASYDGAYFFAVGSGIYLYNPATSATSQFAANFAYTGIGYTVPDGVVIGLQANAGSLYYLAIGTTDNWTLGEVVRIDYTQPATAQAAIVRPLAMSAALFSVSATTEAAQPISAANLQLGTQTTTTHASQPAIVTNFNGLTVYTNADTALLRLDTPAQEVQRPGQAISLGAISTGKSGPYTLKIDWGDGTSSQLTLSGTAIPPQAHNYDFGYHTIKMAVSDPAGDVAYNDISLLSARPHVTPPASGQPAPPAPGQPAPAAPAQPSRQSVSQPQAAWVIRQHRAIALKVTYNGVVPSGNLTLRFAGNRHVRLAQTTRNGNTETLRLRQAIPARRLPAVVLIGDTAVRPTK